MTVLAQRRGVVTGYGSIWCRLAHVAGIVRLWRARSRGRRRLSELNDAALKDIGVSRVDAWAEVNTPFWRP